MRFSDRITFVNIQESYYDPDSGEYVEGEQTRTVVPCKTSRLGIERTKELFGSLDTHITVVRLQRPFLDKFNYVLINQKEYKVKRQSDYNKGVFYLEGAF